MVRLILVFLFWPVIVWFYGSIIGIIVILFVAFAEVLQRNLLWLLEVSSVMLLGYFMLKHRNALIAFFRTGKEGNRSSYLLLPTKTEQDIDATEKFVPTTNLYCYWCTAKLGIKAWERSGHYYCEKCYKKGNI